MIDVEDEIIVKCFVFCSFCSLSRFGFPPSSVLFFLTFSVLLHCFSTTSCYARYSPVTVNSDTLHHGA
jgi:hypothetical protein